MKILNFIRWKVLTELDTVADISYYYVWIQPGLEQKHAVLSAHQQEERAVNRYE